MRPTLLNSCARAATAAEARFRIDYQPRPRASRVIALDEVAAEIVRDLAGRDWQGGHFLTLDQSAGVEAEPRFRDPALGAAASLGAELDGADVAVMIATAAATPASALAASAIGDECAFRGIMSAGLVLTDAAGPDSVRDVVTALRPNAMVLVVLSEVDDIAEILTALRV
jgi:hypothetical protein